MSPMRYMALTAVVLASACGQVADAPPPPDSTTKPTPTSFTAEVAQVPTVEFGGSPYCKYTITLRSLVVHFAALGDQVDSATVQNDNAEAPVPPCDKGVIPVKRATYTLDTATRITNGFHLSFTNGPDNEPMVDLVADVTLSAGKYSAALTFHRSDIIAPLDWKVSTTLPLIQQ